jgi:hypothetical protein
MIVDVIFQKALVEPLRESLAILNTVEIDVPSSNFIQIGTIILLFGERGAYCGDL